jgi:alpha-L-fucosidase
MTMTDFIDLTTQLRYFDANVERLFERMLQEIADDRPQIIENARRRLEMGFGIYGDEGWHYTTARLAKERREEYADAVNYLCMESRQGEAADPFAEYAQEPVIAFVPDQRFIDAINGDFGPDD